MPELPEVETVCRGLNLLLQPVAEVKRIHLERGDLRRKITAKSLRVLFGQKCLRVHRRAKYLLFEFERHVLINHLGMTGSWRAAKTNDIEKHDHFLLVMSNGNCLVFNDPRRFGLLQVAVRGEEFLDAALRFLGPEPLSLDFNGDWIFSRTRKKKCAIKIWLMDQKQVVGVGNIYASEALFRAGVRPQRKAHLITRRESEKIQRAVVEVLTEAITSGGSTIRDFKQTEGSKGDFQHHLFVYARKGKPCRKCARPIHGGVIGGRSTYWCSSCQKT